MRLRREKKLAAALGAVILLLAGVAGLGSNARAFGPAAESLGCRVYFGDAGTGDIATTYNDTFALTASDTTPAPGDTVTVTFSGVTGLSNGPVGTIAAGSWAPSATIDVTGATTDTLTLTSATPYPAAPVGPNGQTGPYTLTGTFLAAAGTTTLALEQLRLDDTSVGNPFNADTYCTDADANLQTGVNPKTDPVVSTVIVETVTTGDGTPTGAPTVTVTETVTETAPPTATATVTETFTQTAAPTATATVTETVTVTVGATATQTVTEPGETVTVTEPGETVTVTATPTATPTDTCKPTRPPKPDHGYGHPHSKHHKKWKGDRHHGHGHSGEYAVYGVGWNGDRGYGHPHSVHHQGRHFGQTGDRHGHGGGWNGGDHGWNGGGDGGGWHHDDDDCAEVDEVAFAGVSGPTSGSSGGGAATALSLGAALLVGAAFLGYGVRRRPRGLHS